MTCCCWWRGGAAAEHRRMLRNSVSEAAEGCSTSRRSVSGSSSSSSSSRRRRRRHLAWMKDEEPRAPVQGVEHGRGQAGDGAGVTCLQSEQRIPISKDVITSSSASAMWFIRDACGIVCAVITWLLVLYAEFVVLFVMLLPSKNLTYSIVNGTLFNTLAFLALASHLRACALTLVCKRCIRKMDHHCPWSITVSGEQSEVLCAFHSKFTATMYIALISLHALVMVVFHFLYCFEDDWTKCSSFSPPATVILLILLCFEGLLFLIFTSVMFGTQVHSICTDETTSGTLTEKTKLDAVVVTVALAEEELCWRALEKKVHMTVLQFPVSVNLLVFLRFAMNKNKASGVSWVKPSEPSFLKKFKNDVGYKEGPTVDTKRHVMPTPDDDSGSDREDELPQVVVLKSGDLTEEEVKKIKDKMHKGSDAKKGKTASFVCTADDGPSPDDKIIFKKPAKRSSSDQFRITASTSKKKKSDKGEEGEEEEGEENKKKKEKPGKK
ncbi:hypothetical protein INR49_002617, partial [Caranx melampygus]